jgi:hypothetical protein
MRYVIICQRSARYEIQTNIPKILKEICSHVTFISALRGEADVNNA